VGISGLAVSQLVVRWTGLYDGLKAGKVNSCRIGGVKILVGWGGGVGQQKSVIDGEVAGCLTKLICLYDQCFTRIFQLYTTLQLGLETLTVKLLRL
jgi:hypothetical protein